MRRQEMMSLLLGVLLAALLREAGAVTCFAGSSSVPLCSDPVCAGACIVGVGCYCGDGTPCLPSACDSNTTPCCPAGLYWYPDSSCCSDVLNCEPACASDEVCTDNAGIAECTCNETTYQHANRSQIVPTVQCEGSVMTVSLKKCLLQRFMYSVPGIHYTDPNCTDPSYEELVGGERWVRAQAIPQAGWCGNNMTINSVDKKLTFSNVLFVPQEASSDSTLKISFSCTYNLTMQTSLQTVLHPIIGTVTLPSVNGSGPIIATMAAYMTNAFTNPYTVDDTLTVGTPLYIGISATFTDADVFSLGADKCVASPSDNPGQPGVLLISSGCPVMDAVDVQIIRNGDSLEVMFQMETFAFNGQSAVYMSCDVSLCPKTTPDTCGLALITTTQVRRSRKHLSAAPGPPCVAETNQLTSTDWWSPSSNLPSPLCSTELFMWIALSNSKLFKSLLVSSGPLQAICDCYLQTEYWLYRLLPFVLKTTRF